MKEPAPQTDLALLTPKAQKAIRATYAELEAIGYHPKAAETLRSDPRHAYLYGIGRTHHLRSPRVTWNKHSKHQDAQAIDSVDAETGYDDPTFFHYLGKIGATHGLRQNAAEPTHLELIIP
jgi:hypothetical protein